MGMSGLRRRLTFIKRFAEPFVHTGRCNIDRISTAGDIDKAILWTEAGLCTGLKIDTPVS